MSSGRVFGSRWRVSVCLLLATAASAAVESDDQAAIHWLRQNAIPIQTVEAGLGFSDLEPLKKVVGDARIVELGEATHGTREFFQLKHRMVEFLASQKGFTIFSIEANMPEAYRLNDFVLNGNGNPKDLLKGMYFWTWNTEEVLDMILWMREFNKSGKGRIEFTGFDMQTPTLSMDTVRKFAISKDSAYYSATLDLLYGQVSQMRQQGPNNFGVATAKLPIQVAAGKHVTLSGYIRSEGITDGYAGLWIRADGVKGSSLASLAFGDMHDRGVTGTTPWAPYEVSIDVPANATGVMFGAVQTGGGTAWIDSLRIEIDGDPYSDEAGFDLGFESSTLRGFYTGGQGYEVAIDSSQAQSGKQSLRMQRVAPMRAAMNEKESASSLVLKCSEVVKYFEDHRARYRGLGATAQSIDCAIQNARLVLQYVQLKSGAQTRDESMAENVKWIADQNPDAKIVVWAHNGHVSNTGFSATASMGSYLRRIYGKQLVNFGFAFNEGSFQAVEIGKGLHNFTVGPAPEGTLDRTLAAVGIPVFAVDLRQLPKEGPVAEWFKQPHSSRSIGSGYSDTLAPNLWSSGPANVDFDVLLFVEKTTAARPNP